MLEWRHVLDWGERLNAENEEPGKGFDHPWDMNFRWGNLLCGDRKRDKELRMGMRRTITEFHRISFGIMLKLGFLDFHAWEIHLLSACIST